MSWEHTYSYIGCALNTLNDEFGILLVPNMEKKFLPIKLSNLNKFLLIKLVVVTCTQYSGMVILYLDHVFAVIRSHWNL